MRRTFHFLDIINYKKIRSKCRKTILHAKRLHWERFCSSINIKTNINRVRKVYRAISNSQVQHSSLPITDDRNAPIAHDVDKANLLGHEFAKVSSSANYTSEFLAEKSDTDLAFLRSLSTHSAASNCVDVPFTMSELKRAISSRKSSSPGQDSVCYEMLKNLPRNALERLLFVFNTSWKTGIVPESWRHVVPLLKNGKDPDSAASYRPISLTSHMCKVMEVMVANRLRWFLESKNLLDKSQCGFCQGRSTLDHIIRLHDSVYKSINHKRSVVAVFLDIKKRTIWYGEMA